ncbi:MAG TPA: DUF2723 domain-containing protein [Anaerolineae bacterium]|nr:DUF2723 domain-containing protein [Anaerolineae bacterium]
MVGSKRARLEVTVGLFVVVLMIYVSTLAPSVVTIFDDSLEFQLVTYQLGIPHPTGYPLYVMLGKFFTLLPVGNIAYRVNLMSAVFGAATVVLVYLLSFRLLPAKSAPGPAPVDAPARPRLRPEQPAWAGQAGSVFGALLLAVGWVFWQQAPIAEVYTLNAFFVGLILLVALSSFSNPDRSVLWLSGLLGLSLAHHRTTLLLIPAVGVYLLLGYGSRLFQPRLWLLGLVSGLLPLLLYLYLPLRGHVGSLDGSYQNTWSGFWEHVTASGYSIFIVNNPLSQQRDWADYWALLADQFYTTALGWIGLLALIQRGQYRILTLTGLAFATYLGFNLLYNVADIEVFFIPIFLIWAVWSGVGAAYLLETMARLPRPAWRWSMLGLLALVFGLILIQLSWSNYGRLKQLYTWQVHDYGIDLLRQPLDPAEQPVIIGLLGEMTLIRYFQQTEGLRSDLETIAADEEAARWTAIERALVAGKTVYLTRELAGLPQRYALDAVGPLLRIEPEPGLAPLASQVSVNQPVTPEIWLSGYSVSAAPQTGAGLAPVRLTLIWQPVETPATDLKVSARLLAPNGETEASIDAGPVHFAYPTTAWRPGEFITDVYDLRLPPEAPAGLYTPLIIWYDPAREATEVGRIELAPVQVK